MATYTISFRDLCDPDSGIVRTWSGYATWADARRAIADADGIIPFFWAWKIEEVPAPGDDPNYPDTLLGRLR